MSILKLSKKDIIRNEDNEEKIKLKRSDLSYDSARVSGWEQTNRESLDILNNYNSRINNSEWLSEDDRATYRNALDSYIESSNRLRVINKTFGEGYSDEDEKTWLDSVSAMNKGYDEISSFYSQFPDDRTYNNWYKSETKRKEYESTLMAEDLEEYSQLGAGVTNPNWVEAEAPLDILGWKPLGNGKTVNNMVTFAEANKDNVKTEALRILQGGYRDDHAEVIDLINAHMTDDEKKIYNYYVGKGDTEKANEYLTYITDILRQRQAGEISKKIDNTALEAVFSLGAGLDQFVSGIKNLDNFITGAEADPTTTAQYAHGEMSGNNEGLWMVTNDLLHTTGNMLPSILVGSVTGGLGGALTLGVSATGNAYSEMRKLGYDEWQSRGYAALTGASEAVLSYFLGGISKLGGGSEGIFQTIAGKIIPHLDNAVARVAIQVGGNMLDEGLEEAIQEVLDPIFKMAMTGEEFEGINLGDVLYSGLLGALSAGMLEGAPTIAGNIHSSYKSSVANGGLSNMEAVKSLFKGDLKNAYNTGKQAVTENAGYYADEALKINPDNAHAQRMKARIGEGKNVSGYQINRLVADNENALVSQDRGKMKSAIEARLTELGETGDVGKIADVITKQANGEKLTIREKAILENSEFGTGVVREMDPELIEQGRFSNKWAESIGTERINSEAYSRGISETDEASVPMEEKAVVTENAPVKESSSEGKISASEGKVNQPVAKAIMTDNEGNNIEAKVAGVAEVENGEATLELEGGQTVKASEVDFGESGIGFVYNAATEMVSGVGGFNVDAANVMVRGFASNGSLQAAGLYVSGFNEAYRYGAMGYPVSALETGKATSKLSKAQREAAYNLGKAYGEGKVAEKQAKVTSTSAINAGKDSQKATKKGKVYFDGSAVGKNLTERQRASLKGLRVIAEATGVNIRIFESEMVDGKRQGANGWYDPVTKEIHLDLHAGVDGNALMLYTGAHELTHHIREVAPAKFKIFADALLEEYTKNGVSIEELISRKLETLEANKRLEGKTDEEAYDLAYEEVVADSAEAMLVDSDAIEALSRKIQANDKGLWETIKDFIAKLVNRIRAAYEGVDPDSREGKLVREMKGSAEMLQKLWVDALLEASEANVEQTLGESGVIVDSKTESASLMSVRDLLTDADRKYDGIAYSNTFETKNPSTSYIVFNSNQAKEITNMTPTSNPDIRYSDRDIQKTFDIKSINDYVGVQKAVINTLTKEGFFSDGNNIVVNKDSGMVVEIKKDGIRETLGSGTRFQTLPRELKELKLSTIHSLPYLIETAHLDSDDVMNMHNSESKVKYAYLSTDVDVQRESGKSTYTVTITVRKSPQKNKFWIHEIRTTKKEQGLSSGGDVNPQQEYNKTLAQEGIIPQDSGSVKREFSDRSPDSYSNRSLLANALETAVQNDIERQKLEQYKQKIALINAEEQKLHDLREQIKELSFAKGPRDTKAIKDLQFEANQAANRINTYDRQLLNLESTKALKGVLEREKALARKKAEKQGKEALERYREKAAKTQRALMDRYQESRKKATEGRHKTAMRHKIKDVVNELNQYLLKGTKDKHVPIELQKAVAEALDAVNMDTVGAEERIAKKRAEMMSAKSPEVVERLAKEIEHIGEMGGNMEAKLSRLKTAYDSIINSEDPLVANSHDEVISNTIERVMEVAGNTPLRDMSLYQLEAVYDMYRMVLHSIRTANKAFKAKKSEEISVIANRVMEEVDKLGKKKALQTKAGVAISAFDWNNQKPIYAFERIGSGTFTEVFNNVRAGEDTWAVDMTEAKDFLDNQKQAHKYESWDFEKRYAFTSSTGKRFELSLDQIMSLYAYSKRGNQAKDHLKYGGFVFDGLTEVKQKTKLRTTRTYQLKDVTAYNLSDEILAEIISKLTPEQKAFADEMQNYLSTVMGEKGNEVSLELYGVKLFKEKNYFPLKSAPQYLKRAREQAQGDTKIKNKGFTKETTPKAKNPIVLTSFMDVWSGHVNEMSMYHAFTLALEDFYRVFNYKTPASENMDSEGVIPFIENAHGNAAVGYIDQLLKDLNGGARSDPRETQAKRWLSNFKKASVIASLSVVIQQPSAIVRAEALVDAKYFVGKKLSQGKHKETWAEVKKYAPVAVIKEMGYFDTGIGQSSTEWLKGEQTWKDKVDDALSKAPALADELTWVAIWNAVKREVAHNNPTLKTSSEEFLRLAGERFTEVVTKTQVYDSTLARSANMRSKTAYMSMLTAFMAEPTTSINMLQDAIHKGNKRYIARTIGAVYGSVILNSALVSLVYAMRDDDDDETFLEKYLSRFVTEVVDGVNPLTYVPFVKDIWSALQGFDIERADMTLISALTGSLQQLVKVVSKDTSDMSEEELDGHHNSINEKILGVMESLASLTGLPVKNIRREIKGIINGIGTIKTDIEGRETTAGSLGDNILEDVKDSVPVWGWLPDESKGDKLYDAIVKGDTAYVDRLKSGYKSETAYQSAIRKALRENDPRIKEAAEAVISGKGAEFARLLDEIAAEGKFARDVISGAIAAEAEKLRNANK